MSGHSNGQSPAAPASRPKRTVPRWAAWAGIAAIIPVCLIVPLGFEMAARLVPPDALQASEVAEPYGHIAGRTLVVRQVIDTRTVADLYARINSLPSVGINPAYSCPLAGPDAKGYRLRFTRVGVPIEVASMHWCGGWWVSRGGITINHDDPNGETPAILAEAQLPFP